MNNVNRSAVATFLAATVCALPLRCLAEVDVLQLYSTPDGEYQAILLEDDQDDGVDRFSGLTFQTYDARGVSRSITLTPAPASERAVLVDGKRRVLLATRQLSYWLRAQAELPDAFLAAEGMLTVSGFPEGKHIVMNVGYANVFDAAAPASALARHPQALPDEPTAAAADFFAMPPPGAIVREFYHADLDRYFLAATQREKSNLDAGSPGGWERTGNYFRSLNADAAQGATVPVCRYYLPPPLGNTHFYSAFAEECEAIARQWPAAILETSEAFRVALPEPSSGLCIPTVDLLEPQNSIVTAPLYRVWNGTGANHRFTTKLADQADRMLEGWIAEGYGPYGTAMCVDTFDVGTFPVPKARPKPPRKEDGR